MKKGLMTILLLLVCFTLVGCGEEKKTESDKSTTTTTKATNKVEDKVEMTDKEKLVGCWDEENNGTHTYHMLSGDIIALDGYKTVDGSSDVNYWESYYDLTGYRYLVSSNGTVTKKVEAFKLYDYNDKESGMTGYDSKLPEEVKGRPWLMHFPFREEGGLFSVPTMYGVLVWEDDDHFSTYFENNDGIMGYYHKNTRIDCNSDIFKN